MKIRDFELKDQTVLEIGKFAILWNWFEKEFCHNECNYKELKKVAPYVKIDFQSQKDLAEVFEQRRFLFEQMIEEYVRTALYPDNAKRPKTEPEERKAMEGFLAQKEEYIVLGCLMSI